MYALQMKHCAWTAILMRTTCNALSSICVIGDALHSHEYSIELRDDAGAIQTPNNENSISIIGECWYVAVGQCYTYNISRDEGIHSDLQSQSHTVIITDSQYETLGRYENVTDSDIQSNHFCLSPDLEAEPLLFLTYAEFGSSQVSSDRNRIYHRDRDVYSTFNENHNVCTAFRATQVYDDNLSLQMPDQDKPCDENIDFQLQSGYCECFGGKIMSNVVETSHGTCADFCNASMYALLYSKLHGQHT